MKKLAVTKKNKFYLIIALIVSSVLIVGIAVIVLSTRSTPVDKSAYFIKEASRLIENNEREYAAAVLRLVKPEDSQYPTAMKMLSSLTVNASGYLGVSKSDLIIKLGKIFPVIKNGEPVHGLTNTIGKTDDGLAQFQLLSESDKVKEASLEVFARGDINSQLLKRNALILTGFLICVFPDYGDINKEVYALLSNTADHPNQQFTAQINGMKIEAKFLPTLGVLSVIIKNG